MVLRLGFRVRVSEVRNKKGPRQQRLIFIHYRGCSENLIVKRMRTKEKNVK